MGLIYCYGVIGEKQNLENIKGFSENQVHLIEFQDIFAVVGDVSEELNQESIDKNIKNMGWLVERGKVHEQVGLVRSMFADFPEELSKDRQ